MFYFLFTYTYYYNILYLYAKCKFINDLLITDIYFTFLLNSCDIAIEEFKIPYII